ncbi:MAG: excinuclease ABC subunit UvrA [Halobacteriovoraceae bacterium]|nr:excinuclease ABC subunit UvrA [Halobacteriovoraceae bacterium]
MKKITIHKANVHNLKNISVEIPRGSLTVITGPSGSGKSSLAFDTLYAEGQRRYIESLSSYARQFLGQMEPPDVESISGLSPAIAIDQKSGSRNPRSTVGTVTEIYDYMRILYARVGTAHCPECGEAVSAQTKTEIQQTLLEYPQKTKLQILAPIIYDRKGEHKELLQKYQSQGFSRIYLNGEMKTLDDQIKIDKNKRNTIQLVIDRLVIKPEIDARLLEALEYALKISQGHVHVYINDDLVYFSEKSFCSSCQISYPDLEPRLFSFNSPLGSCEQCKGLGETKTFTPDNLIEDANLSIEEGAIPFLQKHSFFMQMVRCIANTENVDLSKPLNKLPKKFFDLIFKGSSKQYTYKFESENSKYSFKKKFEGSIRWLERRYNESSSEKVKTDLEALMDIRKCPVCEGMKLKPFPLAVGIKDKNIFEASEGSITDTYHFFTNLKFKSKSKTLIANKVLKEINERLGFLLNIGLDYLTLNRQANTLSGGENQRIRLATQIGSALSGVLYVLDEPSIGLHQRDNVKLIQTLKNLRDLGNTVVVVEHDEETMLNADYLIDMGPAAGIHGGEIVDTGTPEQVIKRARSTTTKFLSKKLKIEIPHKRRELKALIQLEEAKGNNLKAFNLAIPLGGLVCITGVSGSGKSTLVHQVLAKAVKNYLKHMKPDKSYLKSIKGLDSVQSMIKLDQSPIGRTPKSNPATYTGLFDSIRQLFSQTQEAKIRGYKQGRFSFNVKGGRCDKCEGNGQLKIEMHFLPDVFIICDECSGKRYNEETLNVFFRGKNIYDVLEMSVEEARDFFTHHPRIFRIIDTLYQVGLGYIKLGQSATTLSGGEAQRMKLARELAKNTKGHTLYILDEPTTGLHFQDIKVLLEAINRLIDQGNSVIVIEHNLDVIKASDWIIDLGPDGGDKGGEIVAEGTPEFIVKSKKSYTGKFLKPLLKG